MEFFLWIFIFFDGYKNHIKYKKKSKTKAKQNKKNKKCDFNILYVRQAAADWDYSSFDSLQSHTIK